MIQVVLLTCAFFGGVFGAASTHEEMRSKIRMRWISTQKQNYKIKWYGLNPKIVERTKKDKSTPSIVMNLLNVFYFCIRVFNFLCFLTGKNVSQSDRCSLEFFMFEFKVDTVDSIIIMASKQNCSCIV